MPGLTPRGQKISSFIVGILSMHPAWYIANSNILPADLTYEVISDSRVDALALTLPSDVDFGEIANGRVYQQNMLITHDDKQYIAYYNSKRHVCVGRRELPDGIWEVLELTDYKIISNDSHNVVCLGIAAADGTLHLAFDHHVDELNYRKSIIGAVDSEVWTETLFEPIKNALIPGNPLEITYPRFESTLDGNLLFAYRTGYPSNGDRHLQRYNAKNGNWESPTLFVSKSGNYTDNYGTSTSRSGYLNPLCHDTRGRLHTSWVWRENATKNNPGSKDNHDLMYMYSDNDGVDWNTGNGDSINNSGNVNFEGITAVEIPRGFGLINSNAMTVDKQGRVHVVVRHCTEESLLMAGSSPGAVAFGAPEARRHIHYWREFNNTWRKVILPGVAGRRSAALFSDQHGNLYFARMNSKTLELLQASAWQQWTDWKIIFTHEISTKSEILIDTERWEKDAVISIPYQKNPRSWGNPSALHVIEIAKKSGEVVTPKLYQNQINTNRDAYARNNGTQDGKGPSLYVKNATNDAYDRKTFLRFDLKKLSLPIFNAELKMHTSTVSSSTRVSLYVVNDTNWTEDGINWDNSPSLGEAISYTEIHPRDTWVTWDLTEFLSNNVGINPSLSLALWIDTPNNSNLTFRSREFLNGSFKPHLKVESASIYSEWAIRSGLTLSDLSPDFDANHDGIPNLIAYTMGADSVNVAINYPSVELELEGEGIRASIRRASHSDAFNPRIEQRSHLNYGNWIDGSPQIDLDYYGTGIDRLSITIPSLQDSQFFRYAAD